MTAMTSDFPCDVFDHREPASGTWNMALDEALLERALAEGIGHFRLYRWSAPTISLGYFQDYDPAAWPEPLRGLDVVRRLSGGGAILHHHELTYSCSLPPGHPYSGDPTRLYVDVHQVLIAQLAKQNFECRFRGTPKSFSEGVPFLCYSRGDERDLVHRSHKIVGSAQRRRKGAILQHGSVLLRRSEFAPEFPGVEDLADDEVSLSEDSLCEDVLTGASGLFPLARLRLSNLEEASDRARKLVEERYQFVGKRFRKS
jgi:lipoate-protein ligase A